MTMISVLIPPPSSGGFTDSGVAVGPGVLVCVGVAVSGTEVTVGLGANVGPVVAVGPGVLVCVGMVVIPDVTVAVIACRVGEGVLSGVGSVTGVAVGVTVLLT